MFSRVLALKSEPKSGATAAAAAVLRVSRASMFSFSWLRARGGEVSQLEEEQQETDKKRHWPIAIVILVGPTCSCAAAKRTVSQPRALTNAT